MNTNIMNTEILKVTKGYFYFYFNLNFNLYGQFFVLVNSIYSISKWVECVLCVYALYIV